MEAELIDSKVPPEQAKAVTAVFRSMGIDKVDLSRSTTGSLDYVLQEIITETVVRKGIVFRLHNWISDHTPEPAPLLQCNMFLLFLILQSFPFCS